jgi:hypothetical protein
MMQNRGCQFAVVLGAIVVAVILLWLKFGGAWTIDSCLDSGGFWDESAGICRR